MNIRVEDDMPAIFQNVLKAIRSTRQPRIRTIAKAAGISRSYAHKVVHQLAERGLIKIESDPGCRLKIKIPPH